MSILNDFTEWQEW